MNDDQRIERMERELTRLRRRRRAFALALPVALLVAARAPAPSELRVEELVLVEGDTPRALLSADGDEVSLRLYDLAGRETVWLGCDGDRSGLTLSHGRERPLAQLWASSPADGGPIGVLEVGGTRLQGGPRRDSSLLITDTRPTWMRGGEPNEEKRATRYSWRGVESVYLDDAGGSSVPGSTSNQPSQRRTTASRSRSSR